MADRAERQAAEQLSTSEGEILRPLNREHMNDQPLEEVSLGVSSRFRLVETGQEPTTLVPPKGLLPVPAEVEAEVKQQEAKHAMTPEYCKKLRDRLTRAHYFADALVAFRRTPNGIEVLAAGLDEIAEFRRTSTREQRQGVVYGVG
jgi:hypothetical protein